MVAQICYWRRRGAFLRDVLVDELSKGLDAAARLSLDAATTSLRETLLGPPDRPRAAAAAMPAAAAGPAAAPQTGPEAVPAARPGPVGAGAATTSTDAPGGMIAGALRGLPRLAGESDKEQVEGLQRLAGLLQQLAARQSGGGAPGTAPPPADALDADDAAPVGSDSVDKKARRRSEPPPGLASIASAANILNWIVSEAGKLPPEQQQVRLLRASVPAACFDCATPWCCRHLCMLAHVVATSTSSQFVDCRCCCGCLSMWRAALPAAPPRGCCDHSL